MTSTELDLNDIKDFFEANGYDWSFNVIDKKTNTKRNAQPQDFNVVDKNGIVRFNKLPILVFAGSTNESFSRSEEFYLALLVTDGRFELYQTMPGESAKDFKPSLYDDLSMEYQTYKAEKIGGKGEI